ncbi:MAG: hypothetical protein CR979_01480 [Propionibacterium sp.]|nr:MAG: hypothetical protein CR979_01480 [Propionibacterium sp.]
MHNADIQALRRALVKLDLVPGFVLSDGFAVDGLTVPGLGIWKGDRVAGCIAAASVVAKVTRDRIMTAYQDIYPEYNFAKHKGYCTASHQRELESHGPCDIHRFSFNNVAKVAEVSA